ncbi:MAG: 1,4-alpha-glucan branching protein domain-containing protein [Solirubrobacterales bacterium]
MAAPKSEAGGDPGHLGAIAIVLHSHMPYVEGFGTYPFGEEWLFDAAIRSYLPVLAVADRLTVTVTPVLADQLEDGGVHGRLLDFARLYRLGSAQLDATEMETAELRAACTAEADRYGAAVAELERLGGDLIGVFREPAAAGRVELMASAATHAILPLIATRGGRRLQIETGLRSHRRRFGPSRGFWLPECAYAPGIEPLLAEAGVDYFCVDQSRHEPATAALRPALSDGITGFTIDREAIEWLWSMDGYPSDPCYADFHRKSLRGTRPWAINGEAYEPARAAARAIGQADQFVAAIAERLRAHRARSGAPGLITFAIDTELLGHWWWEGPTWLAAVLERLEGSGVRALTLSDALAEHRPEPRRLQASTWGAERDFRTWDSPAVADLAWGTRKLELRLLRELFAGRLQGVALERAARELLAVQASDWAFLDYHRQAGDYPFQRSLDHARELFEAINSGERADPALRSLAPDLTLAPLLEP